MANANVKYGILGFAAVMVVVAVILVQKIQIGYIGMLLLGILALVLLLAPVLYVKQTKADTDGINLNVTGSNVRFSAPLDSIRTFELRDKMVTGNAVKASTNGWMAGGKFNNPEFGDYTLSANTELHAFIVVRHSGNVLVFNLKTDEDTRAFYDSVKPLIPENPRRR